jgi:ATP-dependent Clp protease ATP-binding subunit ClpA
MFERFTQRARTVVVEAQNESRRMDAPQIGTEHLLLALLADDEALGARILHGLGVDATSARREVTALAASDSEALAAIGIDLETVRRRVEETFGRGALERTRRRRGWFRRRGRHVPFTPGAKKVLELSLREALQLDHKYIGTEHILIALLRDEREASATVLRRLGVRQDADGMRTLVREALRRAA